MSNARIILRVVLVLMVIGLGWVLFEIWRKSKPEYYWERAQAAIAAKRYEAARIHLQNLTRKHKEHAAGHLALADVILEEAEANKRPTALAANPQAVIHLGDAAKLQPDNIELQKRALDAFLQTRQLSKAAEIADIVVKAEPNNGDANFALIWRAVEKSADKKESEKAEALFEQFKKVKSRRIFQTYVLKSKFYFDRQEEDKVDATLAEAMAMSKQLKNDEFQVLTRLDREAMLTLLLGYQDRAKDADTAMLRATAVIEACEKLVKNDLVSPRTLAMASAQAIALFNSKYPPLIVDTAHRATRLELAERASKMGMLAIESKEDSEVTGPLVYWQTAQAAFARNENEKGLEILNKGILAAQKLNTRAQNQHLDLHLLAARRLIMLRRFEEADKHLDKLMNDAKFAGWGHLLRGSVALHEGRLEAANDSFQRAQASLGNTILVKMALAHTYMSLERWDKAIPMLESLQIPADQLDAEAKAWHREMLGSGSRVHFDLLRAKLALKQWDKAQVHLKELKGTDLEPNAWGVAVNYLWEQDEKAKALKILEMARAKYPESLPLVLLNAEMLEKQSQVSSATQLLESFAGRDRSDMLRQLTLWRWYVGHREFERALSLIHSLEERKDEPAPILRTMAVYKSQALIGAGRVDEARDEVEKLMQDDSSELAGKFLMVQLSLRNKDTQAAAKYLEQAASVAPRANLLHLEMAAMAGTRGNYEEVLEESAKLLDVTKHRDRARAQVAQALNKIAQTQGKEKAAEKLDELLAKYPNEITLLAMRADLHLQNREFKKGMDLLDNAERAAPDDTNVPFLKSQAWLAQNQPAQAVREAERVLAKKPEDIPALLLAAQASTLAGKNEEALRYATRARKVAPQEPQLYLVQAETLRNLKRTDEAINVLKDLVRDQPDNAGAIMALITAQREANKIEDAQRVLSMARNRFPADMRFTAEEIDVLLKAVPARKSEAQLLARDAVGGSQSPERILAVAQVFANNDQSIDALQWGEQALTAANAQQLPDVHLFLGKVYLRRAAEPGAGDSMYDKAKDHFESVLAVQPRHFIAGNNLAWLLATKFNKPQEAVTIIERVRGDAKVSQMPVAFIDTMATVYRRAGQPKKAYEVLREANTSHPDQAQLLYQFGLVLIDLEQPAAAKPALQRAIALGLASDEAKDAKKQLASLQL